MTLRKLFLGCLVGCVLAPAGFGQCTKDFSDDGFNPDDPFNFLIRPPHTLSGVHVVSGGHEIEYLIIPGLGTTQVYKDGKLTGTLNDTNFSAEIASACGPGFLGNAAAQSFSLTRDNTRAVASAQNARAGKTNQEVAIGDFNGDGVIDSAIATGRGIFVTLYKPDGTQLSAPVIYPIIPDTGRSIVAADFNGDGRLDLAVTQSDNMLNGTGNVFVLLGNGDGTFGTPTGYHVGLANYLAIGDFNGDGIVDLAVTTFQGQTAVAVLLGKGNGSFAPAVDYFTPGGGGALVAADFNGDGKLDLASLGTVVSVLPGRGDGTFLAPVSTPWGTTFGLLNYADLNHDGKLDLLIADRDASAMAEMLGNGDGTFQPAKEYLVSAQPRSLAVLPLEDGNTSIFTADNDSDNWFFFFITSDGTVHSPALQTLGSHPAAIAAADLNGDHQPDLVITDSEAGKVYVKLATGQGQFASPVTYSLSSGSAPGALAIADVNGDGKADVLVADLAGLDVLPGRGDGTLGPNATFPAGGALRSLALADFNSDGKPDVAAANAANGGVSLFINTGNGTFQSAQTIPSTNGLGALAVVSGDVNGDGKPDLIVSFGPTDFATPGSLAVLLGKGDGTFQAPRIIALPGPLLPGNALALGDLNGDGRLDVIVALVPPSNLTVRALSQIAVLPGNGDGTFQTAILTNSNTQPPMMAITDLNGDGKPDLVLADCCGLSEASFLLGNGDGTFQPEVQFPSGPNPQALAVADLNGDGRPDLAIAGQVDTQDRGTLAILFNAFGPVTTPGTTTTTASSVSATFSPNTQAVMLTANVSSNGTPVTAGTVTFTLLGTSISANVVNGTASASFTIPGGTAAGNYPLQVVYNPATGLVTSSDSSHQLTIAKATPVITWATPADIVAGAALGAAQLNATASVPGSFTYTPPAGTVLPVGNGQTLSVLFTPTDTTDYTTQTATVLINVKAAAGSAVLTIAKTHNGSFAAGGTGTYTITVSNAASAGATNGTVTVTDTAPAGLTLVSMAGMGWTCAANGCTRSDALAGGQSYPAITVTVNVAANATSPQVNMASVSGGGSAAATAMDSTVITSTTPAPVLSIAKTHTSNFMQGGSGTYTITVSNAASAGTTSGTVIVTDTAPAGLTLVSMTGAGWTCVANNCTRSDALAAGQSYPAITVTVNVAVNATSPQVNMAGVSGGGSATATAMDSTVITSTTPAPVLSIGKTHTGNFTQGQMGATYSLVVSDAIGAGATSGTITVTDTVPAGLTLVSMSGAGWTCASNACTRSDALAAGQSYPPITATVNVAGNAPASLTNAATVTGGGAAMATAMDVTSIASTSQPAILLAPLALSPGGATLLNVSLSAPAGNGGAFITLMSSDPSVVSLSTATSAASANVLIPQGATSTTIRVVGGKAGAATITASGFGYLPATLGVQVGSASGTALITATGGNPQSASTNTAFSSPLTATVTSGGNPVSGALVTFTAPAIGPGGAFAGGGNSITVMTNGMGVAVSPVFTANSTPGSFVVLASAPGVASPAAFSLTNTGGSTLVLSPLTLHVGDEVILPVSLSSPAGDGVIVTLTSSNPMILSLSTATMAGTANVLIPAGSMSGGVRVVALFPGMVTITAMATGFAPVTTQVNVVP